MYLPTRAHNPTLDRLRYIWPNTKHTPKNYEIIFIFILYFPSFFSKRVGVNI